MGHLVQFLDDFDKIPSLWDGRPWRAEKASQFLREQKNGGGSVERSSGEAYPRGKKKERKRKMIGFV